MKVRKAVAKPVFSAVNRSARAQRGFTIVELMITVAIGAILATIAIPSFRDILRSTRQNSALGLIMNDLNQARGEAIKRNGRMLVCVRNTAGTGCGTVTDWKSGWVVCSDVDGDNACDASTATSPNPVIVRPALDASLSLAASAAVIRFNANSSAVASTLTLGVTGGTSKIVSVANTGNISKQ